jgi:hypothetical protein
LGSSARTKQLSGLTARRIEDFIRQVVWSGKGKKFELSWTSPGWLAIDLKEATK